jgi:3-oxoacyl-[acyl-carrier-protein] synthase II
MAAYANGYQDAKGRPVVVVTGMGLVTALGRGKAANWAAVVAGRSGIKPITRFAVDGLRTTIAGTIDFMSVAPYSAYELAHAIAAAAAEEAVEEARIGSPGRFPGPLYIATPPSELEWPQLMRLYADSPDRNAPGHRRLLAAARTGAYRELARHAEFASIADRMQAALGTTGEPISICTACASGATTIQLGLEAIRRGDTDAALCVGTDATVHPEGLIRFSLLSALSTRNAEPAKASRPFSRTRDGFVVAEGSGAVVLESLRSAHARGARIIGVVRGAGEKADDYHRTRSRPDGSAIIGAIRKTLADAGTAPEEIDYINAHGTSTPENDKMEYVSLKAVLGAHLARVPISSNKSMIGHTLIAAGSVEAVLSLMTIDRGVIPPTINYDDPDPELLLDVVPNVARAAKVRTVLSNSFGFGGQNVCLLLSTPPG